jgi:hypothetical protein
MPCSASRVVPGAHRVVGPGTHRCSGPREVHTTSTPLRAWESCPATAPPTPRHCATLCGMVSNHPGALYPPLPYDRRTTPSKKDGRTLKGMTHDYSAPARDDTVTSGQWERSPPSLLALCDHPRHRDAIPVPVSPYPMLWKHAATGHRHASHCASYGLTSTTPSSPHADGPRTSNLYATPSKPLLDAHRTRHDAPPEARFARITVYSMALYAIPPHVARTVWHACKLLPPWPIKGRAAP